MQDANSDFEQKISRLEYINDIQDRKITSLEDSTGDFQQRLERLEESGCECTNNQTVPGDLTNRVTDLENITGAQQDGINELSIRVAQHGKDIDELQTADTEAKRRLNEVELKVGEIDDLSNQVARIANTTALQQNEITNLKTKVREQETDIDDLENVNIGFAERIARLEEDSDISSEVIGFHARLTDAFLPALTPIQFDNVMVNVGRRYSPRTGVFTAQTEGLYHFEVYWVKESNQYLYMWKNGEVGNVIYIRIQTHAPLHGIPVPYPPGHSVHMTD